MITRRTKIQLMVFVLITLLGVSFVGARYARLGKLISDDAYTVIAHFADSGGIFAGAEVTYRGVGVGQVEKMVLTDEGVDVYLGVKNDYDEIPSDAIALVGNRSAVGEQYVELQPKVDEGPFLEEESEIPVEDTRIPISTDTLLTNLSDTVRSVDNESLKTATLEMGAAFDGTGEDLERIIDTGTDFIERANAEFDITTSLIRDSNTVLHGQIDSTSAIKSFATNLSLFSGSLAGSDKDLRTLIDNGSAAANQLRTFIEDNEVDLGQLINNLVTTGEVVVENIDGVEQILVVYPYVVEGGFTVVSRTPGTGNYDAHFGMIMTEHPPVCHAGYEGTDKRPPQDGSNRKMNMNARCTEPASQSNARGAQHAPRVGASWDEPVAAYDPATGKLTWGAEAAALETPGRLAPRTFGEESWKWLFLQPLLATQE